MRPRAQHRQRRVVLPRTAPYVGVACLALLALASARGLSGNFGALVDAGAFSPTSAAWLTGPVAPQGWHAAAALTVRGSGFFGRAAAQQAATGGVFAVAGRLLALPYSGTPLLAGALAIPALLVAIRLARCH